MATKTIEAGDPFFLDGQDYIIVDHPTKPDELVLFDNPTRRGVCLKREVIWHTHLEKWTMMGRILSVEDKLKFSMKAVEMPWGMSLPGWAPRAHDHEIIRKMIEKEEI